MASKLGLDKELGVLINKFAAYMECDEWHIHNSSEEYEANSDPKDGHMDFDEDKLRIAIKKIFRDAGYIRSDARDKADQLVMDMQNVLKKSENTLKEFMSVRAFVYLDKSQTIAAQVMTGQEWATQYNSIFEQMIIDTFGEEFSALDTPEWLVQKVAFEAAKKAAGIE